MSQTSAGVENQAAGRLLARLRHLQADLPPTARRIASYIDTHAEEIIRMSITELADQVEASEGSIVSLCRRLGASGFQELKILIARELVEPMQFIQEDLHEGDSISEVSGRIFAAHANSLADTRKLLSTEALGQAVELIRAAARIDVYGIGSSGPIAVDLAYRLMQLGLRAAATIDSHMQAVNAAMSGPDVTVVTVSHSGSTVETVLATRLAKEAGAKVIGITRLGRSPLQRYCDVVLHTVANETRYRPEAMSSRVAQLAIVDTLVSCCALADPERSVAKLQLSARVIAEKRY
ncbi:MAG: MurR/RpiR family transcriptional regulator [Hyphomicrobium sp.]|uniref:MurR/RpiR family transcriptional regulator n=1 Tax=Hyphomicrobium sp. CS1BSMeth3 TaxID=1892844 RepID=UPI0009F9A663|nr:MurR/RpiR family transcriptional regulator [Hyphomicrobium sp. CS1BSMeth3]MBN9267699.1 MurR/RpiR family transcriptional regulator [Hyphomicrobium sp.]MBN9280243.1 MurR/RpiR family transcriptional regulator [Hyphomicrobium sp.]